VAQTLRGHDGWAGGVAFSPRGDRLASVGADRLVREWDLATGKEVNVIRGHMSGTATVAFSHDGQRIISGDGEVRVWEAGLDQQARTILREPLLVGVHSVAFSPDGKLLASASHDDVAIHEVATGRNRSPATPMKSYSHNPSVQFTPDGKFLATDARGGTRLWDRVTGNEVRLFPDLVPPPPGQWFSVMTSDLALSPDGTRLATVGSNLLAVWDTATARVIYKVPSTASSVAYSPDGLRIATAAVPDKERGVQASGEMKLWDAASGQELMRFTGGCVHVDFNANGTQLAAAGWDRTATVFDAQTGQVLLTLRGHTDHIRELAFHPDGRRIVTASADGTIKLWDTETGQEVLTLRGHNGPVVSVAFSPDGRYLASATDKSPSHVKIWDGGPGARILDPK
jgi:WD40 repeat protein